MNCRQCGTPYVEPHTCDPNGVLGYVQHTDYAHEIKISNDNTKGEKRVTVHVRSDDSPEEARKLADKLYKDTLGS